MGRDASGGKPDVFVAISRDAGATFGPPVRVNAIEGEARLGGELPPRVAVVSPRRGPAAIPELVVVYGAKTPTTEIKMAQIHRWRAHVRIPAPTVSRPPPPAIAAGTR